jgi:hypothetical protein
MVFVSDLYLDDPEASSYKIIVAYNEVKTMKADICKKYLKNYNAGRLMLILVPSLAILLI